MINQDGIDAGPRPADNPQTAPARAPTRDQEHRGVAQRGAWRRPTITRFGFELTLSDSGSVGGNSG
jgi:hypothetical protein